MDVGKNRRHQSYPECRLAVSSVATASVISGWRYFISHEKHGGIWDPGCERLIPADDVLIFMHMYVCTGYNLLRLSVTAGDLL